MKFEIAKYFQQFNVSLFQEERFRLLAVAFWTVERENKIRDRRSTERTKVMRAEGALGKRLAVDSPVSSRLVGSPQSRRACFRDQLARPID